MAWNARGVRSKIVEVYYFMLTNDIDACLVNETNLNCDVNLCFDSRFRTIRLDRDENRVRIRNRGNPGGGVMIIVKRGIRVKILPLFDTTIIEALGVVIYSNTQSFTLISTYFPGVRSGSDVQKFKTDILKLTSFSQPFFLCGDLNAKHAFWNCVRSNSAGRVLYDLMCSNPFQVHFPPGPTYYPEDASKTPSTLDLVITNGLMPLSLIETNDGLSSSDHLPILFTINEPTPIDSDMYKVKDFCNADWTLYRNLLNNSTDLRVWNSQTMSSPEGIDSAIQMLTEGIKNAEEQSVPRKTIRMNNLQLDIHTLFLISQCNALRRRLKRNRNLDLRPRINLLSRKISDAIQDLINQGFQQTLNSIDARDPLHKKLWKLSRNLRRKQNKMPVLKKDEIGRAHV